MEKYLLGFLGVLSLIISCTDANQADQKTEEEAMHGINPAYMDTTVSPSEDFYTYVNGNWMKSAEIPADRGRWGSFDELRIATSKSTLSASGAILEEGEPDMNSDVGKAVIFYSVAMDTNALDELGIYPIQEYLDAIKNISSPEELYRYVTDYFKINGNPNFNFYVHSGLNNSEVNSLFLGPGALGLPERDYYLNTDSITLNIQGKYKELVVEVMKGFGIGEEDSEQLAEGVFQLEKRMAEK